MRPWVALLVAFLSACRMEDTPSSGSAGAHAQPAPKPAPLPAAPPARPTGHKPAFLHAPAGEVADLSRTEVATAKKDGRALVVYVGATWCEPCQRFHKAVEAGLLDQDFPDVTFLEFDLDDDRDRLAAAGYTPAMIPLFALPGENGRYSGSSFEGSIKGPGAIGDLKPKLLKLLGR
jgi:thiol-disulfide isomerase/thioredoxin